MTPDGHANRSISTLLPEATRRFPHKTALVYADQRLTFGELDTRARGAAAWLLGQGVRPGDRVILSTTNKVAEVIMTLAAVYADAVFVVLPADQKPRRRSTIVRDCAPTVVFTEDEAPSGDRTIDLVPSRRGDDIAGLFYTSGSSGIPKGVMMSHDSIVFAIDAILTYLGQTYDDVTLNGIPLSFDYGLYNVLLSIRAAGTTVLTDGLGAPYMQVGLARREGVTTWPLVPAAIALLAGSSRVLDLPALRRITTTGAALPAVLSQSLARQCTNVEIYSMYGLTECKRALYLEPSELSTVPTSVGRPIPGTSAWLEDQHGRQVRQPGASGELVVSGRHVMTGYWNDEAGTRAVVALDERTNERILRTGDIFRQDDDGRYYFVGRRDDLLKVGGIRVSPRETETELRNAPGVNDVYAFGVEHPTLGRAIEAMIEIDPDNPTTVDSLAEFAREHLEAELVPRQFYLTKKLPRTERGKIDSSRARIEAHS